mmetsp:Transcript_15179/g.45507  ORF Transcript_15179/g.45507 Transcript_15179/m.45507 type:complete len:203 (+) Transcript_15179:1348-1956(+)
MRRSRSVGIASSIWLTRSMSTPCCSVTSLIASTSSTASSCTSWCSSCTSAEQACRMACSSSFSAASLSRPSVASRPSSNSRITPWRSFFCTPAALRTRAMAWRRCRLEASAASRRLCSVSRNSLTCTRLVTCGSPSTGTSCRTLITTSREPSQWGFRKPFRIVRTSNLSVRRSTAWSRSAGVAKVMLRRERSRTSLSSGLSM